MRTTPTSSPSRSCSPPKLAAVIAGRTPREALEAFRDPISRALSCVIRSAVLDVSGGYDPGRVHTAALAGGRPERLVGVPILFAAQLRYWIERAEGERGPWKVSTLAYQYRVFHDVGEKPPEVLAYHWNPGGEGAVTWPHLHVGAAVLSAGSILPHRSHIPTGRVSLERVVRFLIEDLGARPRRDDWHEVLEEAHQAFETWRT